MVYKKRVKFTCKNHMSKNLSCFDIKVRIYRKVPALIVSVSESAVFLIF